eukprot:5032163-Amphidinium_carterae.1
MLDKLGLVHHTTQGYTPQQNGMAETAVKKFKSILRRNLVCTGLPFEAWGYIIKYINNCLLKAELGMKSSGPVLGETVIASVLGPKLANPLKERALVGRLLYHDEFGDKSSYILKDEEIHHCNHPVSHPGVPEVGIEGEFVG